MAQVLFVNMAQGFDCELNLGPKVGRPLNTNRVKTLPGVLGLPSP